MDTVGRRAARDARHGGLEAQARELRERLRMGTLPVERVRVAAALGHPAAALALDHPAASEHELADRLEAMTYGLSKEALGRVALAVCRPALRRWETHRPREDGPRAVYEALEAWAACPCRTHARQAGDAAQTLWPGPNLLMGQPVDGEDPGPLERALHAIATAGRVVVSTRPYDRAELLSAALYAAEAAGEQVVWHAVRSELLRWALAD